MQGPCQEVRTDQSKDGSLGRLLAALSSLHAWPAGLMLVLVAVKGIVTQIPTITPAQCADFPGLWEAADPL